MATIKELIDRLHALENERRPDYEDIDAARSELRRELHDLLRLPGTPE